MINDSQNRGMTVRIIRNGVEPGDDGWMDFSPEDRIEAVWTLTKLCLAWNNHQTDEPRLQRTVTRIQRRKR
jgi:hypothetical protein